MSEEQKSKKVIPLFDRILLEPIHFKQNGALIIPDNQAQNKLVAARVLCCGPGKLNADTMEFLPTQVKVGTVVFVNSYLGDKLQIPAGMNLYVDVDGKEVQLDSKVSYLLMQEDSLKVMVIDSDEV
jgi:co-chaperonin GroES (HSP10)